MIRMVTSGLAVTLSILGMLCGSLWHTAVAQPLTARSDPHTVALLELYTSEGCNSCPPADKWVSSLPAQGFRSDQVIPLAFHVDYWDYLGWPDRFAKAIFTQRQRAIASWHRSRTIFTPQVVLQGQDFRSWHALQATVEQINQTPARANLAIEIAATQSAALDLQVSATIPRPADRQRAALFVALYENQLSSDVKAGENTGRTLHHNYVVRHWLGPLPVDAQGQLAYTSRLSLATDWNTTQLGLVVFMQQQHTGDVLQALAVPLRP